MPPSRPVVALMPLPPASISLKLATISLVASLNIVALALISALIAFNSASRTFALAPACALIAANCILWLSTMAFLSCFIMAILAFFISLGLIRLLFSKSAKSDCILISRSSSFSPFIFNLCAAWFAPLDLASAKAPSCLISAISACSCISALAIVVCFLLRSSCLPWMVAWVAALVEVKVARAACISTCSFWISRVFKATLCSSLINFSLKFSLSLISAAVMPCSNSIPNTTSAASIKASFCCTSFASGPTPAAYSSVLVAPASKAALYIFTFSTAALYLPALSPIVANKANWAFLASLELLANSLSSSESWGRLSSFFISLAPCGSLRSCKNFIWACSRPTPAVLFSVDILPPNLRVSRNFDSLLNVFVNPLYVASVSLSSSLNRFRSSSLFTNISVKASCIIAPCFWRVDPIFLYWPSAPAITALSLSTVVAPLLKSLSACRIAALLIKADSANSFKSSERNSKE